MKDFPIPVVMVGAGSQPVEDDELDYLPMPSGMETFRPPVLPEPEEIAGHASAQRALHQALAALDLVLREGGTRSVDLAGLPVEDLKLINQVLGEGDVSAVVRTGDGAELRVQESVFAGVWRVVGTADGRVLADAIEVGAIPEGLKAAARADVSNVVPRWTGDLPPNVQNAPSVLNEVEDHWRFWKLGQAPQVVNLTLLPMSPEDIGFLDHHLGTGRVTILSRGYGNCRITNTLRPNTWRVVYYNSQDKVILNTVEVSELPDVAQAAPEDLADSRERLHEVLAWVEGA